VALACSAPPAGRERWSLRLLADRMVELGLIEEVSYATVRRVLKNPPSSRGRRSRCASPKASAEFVARMEDLLDLYEEPDDPRRPRVCFDERPCQLLGSGRAPLPVVAGHPARVDDAYTRRSTCHLCIMVEPFQDWHHLNVTPRHTRRAFARSMAEIVAVHCPEAEKIRVVLDHLSTHTPVALYEVFPTEARRVLRRLEFHRTPVYGRWLNRAAIELAILARQCLNRQIPDETTMAREVTAWETRQHRHRATMDWRFSTAAARIKLKRLYPKESP